MFKSNLSDIDNPRLLSIVERTLWFRFTAVHVPGVLHAGPDCLSRRKAGVLASISCAPPMIGEAPIMSCLIAAITHDEGLHTITIQKVKEETDKDNKLAVLRDFIASDDGL